MAMTIFRICGDMSHLASKLILLVHLLRARNARGISVKTQELYLLVFIMRYLDLFTTFYSRYNSCMKIAYITITFITICMIKYCDPIKSVYNREQDSFPHWKIAAVPCLVLALFIQYIDTYSLFSDYDMMEWLWTASILLEAIAILPQLLVLRKYRLVENLPAKFMLCLGSQYRAIYILNWIYRAHHAKGYEHHWLVYVCAVVQTLLYVDFFYQYCVSRCRKGKGEDVDEEGDGLIFELTTPEEQREQLISLKTPNAEPLLDEESATEHSYSD